MPTINVMSTSHEELDEIAHLISKARKVVVITGAGISTNLGIPDFRSDNGLYSLITEQFNKVNSTLETKNKAESEQEGPRKRRKLDRSRSLGSSDALKDGDGDLTVSRRSLRSSKSSLGFEDAPSTNDEEPQPSTVGASRYGSPSDVPTFLPQVPKNILTNVNGKDLFDAVIWQDKKSTETHYTFITSLKHKIDEVKDTSEVHKFIRVLRDGGKLLRNYTQNIDMLEAREGLCTDMSRGPGSRGRFNPKLRKESRAGKDHVGGIFDSGVEVVQLHGNLEMLRCRLCFALAEWEEDDRHLIMLSGKAPPCPKCIEKTEKRIENNRRGLSIGTLRPDIVLYGESNPHEQAIGDLSTHDIMLGPDMLIILGTSLKVHGLKLLLREFARAVHTRGGTVVFVNNTKPPDSVWGDVIDFWVQWDCDDWVRDVKARREEIWMPQGSSREPSPKPSSSQSSQSSGVGVAVPKNPQSMRTDFNAAAYQWDKIWRGLTERSGRANDPEEIRRREHVERLTAARAADGKAFTAKLAAEAASRRAVVKQPIAAQKCALKESAVVNTPVLAPVPPHPITLLPEYAAWKPPSRQPENRTLPASPIRTAADRPTLKKGKRQPRPASVREDKNNYAHYQWETIRRIKKRSGCERVLPDTATARQTFFKENMRAGSGIMEMPPPAARPPTPRIILRLSPVMPTQTLPAPVPASKPSPRITFGLMPPAVLAPIMPASLPAFAPASTNASTIPSLTGPTQMTPGTPIAPQKKKRIRPSRAKPNPTTTSAPPAPVPAELSTDQAMIVPPRPLPQVLPQAKHLRPPGPITDMELQARIQQIHVRGDPCFRGIRSIFDISEWQDQATLAPWDDPRKAEIIFARDHTLEEGRQNEDRLVKPYDVTRAAHPQVAKPAHNATPVATKFRPFGVEMPRFTREMDINILAPRIAGKPFKPFNKELPAPYFTPEMDINNIAARMSATHGTGSNSRVNQPMQNNGCDGGWGYNYSATPFNHPQVAQQLPTPVRGGGAVRSWNGPSWTRYIPAAESNYPTPAHGSSLKNEVRLPTPPSSDASNLSDGVEPSHPMTPKTRRIKNLGSISSILSSPPPVPPTLSRRSEIILGEEITGEKLMELNGRGGKRGPPSNYPPPHGKEQMGLWPGYPDLDTRLSKRDRRAMRGRVRRTEDGVMFRER